MPGPNDQKVAGDHSAGDANGKMEEEEIDLRVSRHPDDAPCRIVWRCLWIHHRSEHNRRGKGVMVASGEQTPGMASQCWSAVRRNPNIHHILVYSSSTRNKVKDNSLAIQCPLVASSRAHSDSYSGSHPVLRCGPNRRHLWRLGLPQNKQRASLRPSRQLGESSVPPLSILCQRVRTVCGRPERTTCWMELRVLWARPPFYWMKLFDEDSCPRIVHRFRGAFGRNLRYRHPPI